MKKATALAAMAAILGSALIATTTVNATPAEDLKQIRQYFKQRFPGTPFEDYVNGVYSIDPESRQQWVEIEEFPPYELNVEKGKTAFETPFANGKTYADCFPNGGIGVRQNYPYFDANRGEVVTLELAINECREANGEKPLGYKRGTIADISAYMAYTSRGNKIDVAVPNDSRAQQAYQEGKEFFYAKRGQLNMSCADCHINNAGNRIRADILSPALGQTTHFPVYRSKWGGLGTLHRRYGGCNEQVRAKGLPAQGTAYRNLEYFHTYMSNGLEVNGPGARK